jgi:MFS family permease
LTIPLVVSSAFFVQLLDTTIMMTSLPQMATAFGVRPLDMGQGLTVYSLVLACALPLAGWIATRYGAKVVFLAATGIFLLGSLACGVADHFAFFIAARAVQGLGGAAMNPVGRIIVLRTTPRSELLAANNAITWPGLIAPLAGPVIGGFVTARFGWRWNFLLNIPIGLACLGLAQRFVPSFPPDRVSRLDRKGILLSSTSLGALLFGLGGLCNHAPGAAAFAGLSWGIAGGILAWRHLRTTAHPVLRLSVLRIPSFRLASLTAGMATRVAISSVPFLLPLLLQSVFGLGALQAGAFLSAYFAGNFLGIFQVPRVLRRFGFRKVMLVNPILAGATIAALVFIVPGLPQAAVWGLLFVAGIVRSIQFSSQSSLTVAEIPPELNADASTLASIFLQASSSLSVVLATGALNGAMWLAGEGTPGLTAFRGTFVAMALLSAAAAWYFRALPVNAGAEMVGARFPGVTRLDQERILLGNTLGASVMNTTEQMKSYARSLGAAVVGIGDLTGRIGRDKPYFAISFGVAYPARAFAKDGFNREIVNGMRAKAEGIYAGIRERIAGIDAGAFAMRLDEAEKSLGTSIMFSNQKLIANLSGLGWIGNSSLLVNDAYGPRLRLGVVITDLPLVPDGIVENKCASCTRCERDCPGEAIAGAQVVQGDLVGFKIDRAKCVRCALCVVTCPKYAA